MQTHSPLLCTNFDDYVALEKKTLQCVSNSIAKNRLPLGEGDISNAIDVSRNSNRRDLFDFSTHWFIDSFGHQGVAYAALQLVSRILFCILRGFGTMKITQQLLLK